MAMKVHSSHEFGMVDGAWCCQRCFAETDWPLIEQHCSGGAVSRTAYRNIVDEAVPVGVMFPLPKRVHRAVPKYDGSPIPEWWDRVALELPTSKPLTGCYDGQRLKLCGYTHTISEWAAITGILRSALARRINVLGWTVDRALRTPTAPRALLPASARRAA